MSVFKFIRMEIRRVAAGAEFGGREWDVGI